MEKLQPINDIERRIQSELKEAKQNAINKKEAENIIAEIKKLKLNSPSAQTEERLDYLSQILDKSTLTVKTLAEFKILVEQTTDDKKFIAHLLAHENAHTNVAEIEGIDDTRYSLLVCKDGNTFSFFPAAEFAYPEVWNEEEKKKAALAIKSAPERYDNALSESDKEDIKNLKEKR